MKEVYPLCYKEWHSEQGNIETAVSSSLNVNHTSLDINLRWTANKTDLVELIYGLYHSASINNGKASIQEIATTLENLFKIDLGDVYRTYSEIRNRKLIQIKFLDLMKSSLQNKINELDEKM